MHPSVPPAAARYLDLLARCLARDLFLDEEVRNVDLREWPDDPDADPDALRARIRGRGWRVVQRGAERGIDAPIHEVDWTAVWWRKPSGRTDVRDEARGFMGVVDQWG